MACLVEDQNSPPSPLWGGTDAEGVRVGLSQEKAQADVARPCPTLDASHPVPPHKGEGGRIARARSLRKSLTLQEARLWLYLRDLRQQGYHFRRQAPFCGYFVDFICFNHRLVVEVDGGGHSEEAQAEHDRIRDAVLRRRGFHTLRVSNGDVNTNMAGVTDAVLDALANSAPVRR
jgi:very-short-patch-repair endonuclease